MALREPRWAQFITPERMRSAFMLGLDDFESDLEANGMPSVERPVERERLVRAECRTMIVVIESKHHTAETQTECGCKPHGTAGAPTRRTL